MHLRLQVQLSNSEESLSKKYPCIADFDMCGLCKVFRGRDAEHAFDPTTEAIRGGHHAKSNCDRIGTGNAAAGRGADSGGGCGASVGKIAGMAHNGLARSINPVHTSADGDSIYAVSVGNVDADQDLAGSLAAEVVSEAVLRSVYRAESAYGLPAAADLGK